MITVNVDGQPFSADVTQVRSMADLIELVKTVIDPDSIIVSLALDGKPLSDADWRMPLNGQTKSQLEICTGNPELYVRERLEGAASYLTEIIDEFSLSSASYLTAVYESGNQKLAKAVHDLGAFVNWYSSLLGINPAQYASASQDFESRIRQIKLICDQLVQQQMFQSWILLGETIKSRLVPELEKLRAFCASQVSMLN